MKAASEQRASTGVAGLDEILLGGLPREALYLVKGAPGTGKTTLAMQFLLEGVRHGEPAVYVTLTESEQDLRGSARLHGFSLDGISIHELGSGESDLAGEGPYTLFHPTEVELGALTHKILEASAAKRAPRVVVDSLAELRLLSGDPLRYRRQIRTFARMFTAQAATVLLLDEAGRGDAADLQIESLARGVIELEHFWPTLGNVRLRLRVLKVRGVPYRGGYHDFTIETGGLAVYPRLRVADHHADFVSGVASTGVPELDVLLGGGLDRGSATLLVGPSGSGKSVLATQIAVAAADRGEQVAFFVFDEVLDAVIARADGLGVGLREHVRSGRITLKQIDPGELAPWQFGRTVLSAVERGGARLVVIDSINGYLNAMPDERSLDLALHELFGCLSQLGTVTVGTLVQYGILGERRASAVDVSYLSDTVVLHSHFEAAGDIRSALSIVKRRRGAHEHSIRELRIGPAGLHVGEPLRGFHGVLTGVPEYLGAKDDVRKDDEPPAG